MLKPQVSRAFYYKTAALPVLVFCSAYSVFLLLYISHLSLWLDELIEISLLNQRFDPWQILKNVAMNAGGVPFGYFTEALSLKLFGITAFAARLPSVLFGIGACLALACLAKGMRLSFAITPVFVLALSPIYVRYSLEARPYAEALCLTTCATLLLIRFIRQPTFMGLVLFFGASLGSIYTQPYAFLPICAQVLVLSLSTEASLRLRVQVLAATGFAVILFIPWLLFAKDIWASGIHATIASSGISGRSILLIVKDLFGMGYLGSCVVFSLCGFALWSASVTRMRKIFLLASILLPIAGVLIADSLSGYFLAIRQMIFVLPPIAILAALGFEALLKSERAKLGWALIAALLVFQVIGNVSWFTRPREDWNRAARVLKENRSRYDCIVFAPEEASALYAIFDPQLPALGCSSSELKTASIVAVSSSGSVHSSNTPKYRMETLGLRQTVSLSSGDPAVALFSR